MTQSTSSSPARAGLNSPLSIRARTALTISERATRTSFMGIAPSSSFSSMTISRTREDRLFITFSKTLLEQAFKQFDLQHQGAITFENLKQVSRELGAPAPGARPRRRTRRPARGHAAAWYRALSCAAPG